MFYQSKKQVGETAIFWVANFGVYGKIQMATVIARY
jgi:hypothetical protein